MSRVLVIFVALAAFAPLAGAQQAAAACPNEDRRLEQGPAALSLPDCRAYELVSPGHVPGQDHRAAKVALNGDRITYYGTRPSGSAETSSYFHLALRDLAGWTVESAAPQLSPAALSEGECEQNLYFSPQLTLDVDEEGWYDPNEPARCKRVGEELVPGEPKLSRNVFLHDSTAGSYQLVNVAPAEAAPANAKFQDASDDFGQIIFSSEAKLTPDAPAGYDFFVWKDGAIRLLTWDPAGNPVNGELVEGAGHRAANGEVIGGSGMAPLTGAFTSDGDRAFFYANGALYMRSHPDQAQSPVLGGLCTEPDLACTVQVDASQGTGPSGGGIFWRADNSGSRVLFTAESRLTPDATAAPGAADLYSYDTETGELTDLTVSGGESADVRGVVAAAEEGDYVYFVANGVLAAGAMPGTCKGASKEGQHCNLYVRHAGTTTFVATLSRADSSAWQETAPPEPNPRRKPIEVSANASANGRFLTFASIESLTGYDNRNAVSGTPDRQILLYNSTTDHLECVSCVPNGERPHGDENVGFDVNYASATPGGNARWKLNVVLDDGSVYFDSPEALVEQDSNGVQDVYQYRDGQHHLISTGTYPAPARFLGVNPSGSDVFFRTPEPLLPSDTDGENASLYDARVDGGFPQPSPVPPACTSESCRGPGEEVPPFPLPATASAGAPSAKKHHTHRCRRKKAKKMARRCHPGKHKKAHGARGGQR